MAAIDEIKPMVFQAERPVYANRLPKHEALATIIQHLNFSNWKVLPTKPEHRWRFFSRVIAGVKRGDIQKHATIEGWFVRPTRQHADF